jgi:positive regulator of sigma E activity
LRILLYVPLAIAVSPVILLVVGCLIFLVLYFFKFVLLLGLAGGAIWFFVVSRRTKRMRQIEASLQPRAKLEVLASPVPPPVPVAPVAVPPTPPRVRRPVCGIWAWVLPLLAVPSGILLGYLAGRGNYEGFQGWAILGWLFLPLVVAMPTSFVLAIVSLCRRERYPSLGITLLVSYAIGLAFGAPLVLLIVGIILSAAWLVRRYRRRLACTRRQT